MLDQHFIPARLSVVEGKVVIPEGRRFLTIYDRAGDFTSRLAIASEDGVMMRHRVHLLVRDHQVVVNEESQEMADEFCRILQDSSLSKRTRRTLVEFIDYVHVRG